MSGRKKRVFAGKNMHLEFHTVNPKKSKPADCIYLSDSRECQNKKAPHYLGKCFEATYCTFKVKEKDAPKPPVLVKEEKEEARVVKIQCSLPKQCIVYSPIFGKGEYTAFDEKSRIMQVTFRERIVKFQYPEAFFAKHLIVLGSTYQTILDDFKNAEKK